MSGEVPKVIQQATTNGNMEYARSEAPLQGDAGPYPYNLSAAEYQGKIGRGLDAKNEKSPIIREP